MGMQNRTASIMIAIFTLLVTLVAGMQVVGASSELWSKTYGGNGMDACTSMVQTPDGGYALFGFAHSFGTDSFLIKTDADGNLEWNKTIGGSGQGAYSFIQTLEGGFAFVGTNHNASAVSGYIPVGVVPDGYWSFIWLAKTDEHGNMEWNQTFDGMSGYYQGHSLVQTADGGYALAGTFSNDTEYDNLLLIKTDSNGNLQWSKSYGGSKTESEPKIIQTSDRGFALACKTYLDIQVPADIWLIKTDETGNIEWNETYGGAKTDYPTALLQLSDDSFAIAGCTGSFGYAGGDFWLIKTDENGDMLWNHTYGTENPETLSSLIQTFDDGFAMAGYTQTDNDLVSNLLLVRIDNLGNMLWNQTFAGGAILGLPSLVQTSDGGFALSGGKGSFETGDWDFWLIKTNPHDISPSISTSETPTQTPPLEPSQTPDRPKIGDFAPVLIPASILLGIVAVVLLVYFWEREEDSKSIQKTFIAANTISLILISLLAGIIFVEEAKANPFFPSGSHTNEPANPLINLQSPDGNITNTSNIWLNFTVTPPLTSWTTKDGSPIGTTYGSISSVKYSLDGVERLIYYNKSYLSILYYWVNLGTLAVGQHTIKIDTYGDGWLAQQ